MSSETVQTYMGGDISQWIRSHSLAITVDYFNNRKNKKIVADKFKITPYRVTEALFLEGYFNEVWTYVIPVFSRKYNIKPINIPTKIYDIKLHPHIGDTAFARELGFKGHNRYIFTSCEICGRKRWTTITHGEINYKHCHYCNNIKNKVEDTPINSTQNLDNFFNNMGNLVNKIKSLQQERDSWKAKATKSEDNARRWSEQLVAVQELLNKAEH